MQLESSRVKSDLHQPFEESKQRSSNFYYTSSTPIITGVFTSILMNSVPVLNLYALTTPPEPSSQPVVTVRNCFKE